MSGQRMAVPAMGSIEQLTLAHSPQQQVLRYLPPNFDPTLAPIVFIHGYSRQLTSQFQALLPLSDRSGRAMLAPFFAREQHPHYQRLGRGRDGLRADQLLKHCCKELLDPLLTQSGRVVLVGYSGGAQFAHRYALAHPGDVERLVAVAAGWYTLPDEQQRFPHGIRHPRRQFHPAKFLAIPTTVMVGAADTGSVNLRRSSELDQQQGITRVARARNWVVAMRAAAQRHQVPAQIRYLEVPGIGHDFEEFVERGQLLALLQSSIDGNAVREVRRAVA